MLLGTVKAKAKWFLGVRQTNHDGQAFYGGVPKFLGSGRPWSLHFIVRSFPNRASLFASTGHCYWIVMEE